MALAIESILVNGVQRLFFSFVVVISVAKVKIFSMPKHTGGNMVQIQTHKSKPYEEILQQELQDPKIAAGYMEALFEEKEIDVEEFNLLLLNIVENLIAAHAQNSLLKPQIERDYIALKSELEQPNGKGLFLFNQLLSHLGFQVSITPNCSGQ